MKLVAAIDPQPLNDTQIVTLAFTMPSGVLDIHTVGQDAPAVLLCQIRQSDSRELVYTAWLGAPVNILPATHPAPRHVIRNNVLIPGSEYLLTLIAHGNADIAVMVIELP